MKKLLNVLVIMVVILIFGLTGCGGGDNEEEEETPADVVDGISFVDEPNGTLTIINNANKDMVIFHGQTPGAGNILGGVRALSSRNFDVSDDVDDFQVGGYLILRGMTADEYTANKNNLTQAKIEYSAMATYGQGKKFRAEITPNWMGDNAYRVTNIGRIGMELRKESPDGEKVGYLPALASNNLLYAASTDGFALYPVFVYFNKSNQTVTTLKPTSLFETVTVSPRPANGSEIQTYIFPVNDVWETIKGSLVNPNAYITVSNNVTNQSGRVTIAGSNRLKSQNGYDSIGSGETLSYEITSTEAGAAQNIVLVFYEGALQLPVRVAEGTLGADASGIPKLKNGYDYTIAVSGAGQNAEGYTISITESANPRDISADIESL